MSLVDKACPRCGTSGLAASFTAGMIVRLAGNELTSHAYADGSDGFEQLWCDTCGLRLANDPGETRLRRAALYASQVDLTCGNELPDNELLQRMADIAGELCDAVVNLDTEVINNVE